MIDFIDSSALLKRYVMEPGSARMDVLLADADEAVVCVITHTEVACALTRRVKDAEPDLALLRRDLDKLSRVELSPEVIDISVTLGVKHRLRGCDALQLAAAVALKKAAGRPVRFICADEDLNRVARAEGLSVLDPGRG